MPELKLFFTLCKTKVLQLATYNIVIIKFTLNTKSVVLNTFYGMTPICGT